MTIRPANKTKKPAYAALLVASAVIAASTLATTSCQQQQLTPGEPLPWAPPTRTIDK